MHSTDTWLGMDCLCVCKSNSYGNKSPEYWRVLWRAKKTCYHSEFYKNHHLLLVWKTRKGLLILSIRIKLLPIIPQPLCVQLSHLWPFHTLAIHTFWLIKGKEKKQIVFLYISVVVLRCYTTVTPGLVGWRCNIYRLHLGKGVRLP